MDQQFGQNQWPNNPPAGGAPSGGSSVPPPPPPPIGIRTMESDLSAVKESGGTMPEPKPFTPSEFKPQAPIAPQKPAETKLNVPGYTGPEEAIFSPGAALPSAGVPAEQKTAAAEAGSKAWMKPALLGGGGLVLLAGLGLVGYFFVFPLIFPATTPPAPVVPPPVQPATTTPGAATTTPPAVFEPHKSFFVIAAEKTEALKVTPADTALSLRAALDILGTDAVATGTAKETLVNKEDGSPESFARVTALLVPELSEATLKNSFEDDFTMALYFDAAGAWPVYIAKLRAGTNLLDAQAALAGFEGSPNLANLYTTDPGAKGAETFKDGSVGGKPTRYLPFVKQGASLNYGWFDNFLMISTSYDAVKDAVRRVGL